MQSGSKSDAALSRTRAAVFDLTWTPIFMEGFWEAYLGPESNSIQANIHSGQRHAPNP